MRQSTQHRDRPGCLTQERYVALGTQDNPYYGYRSVGEISQREPGKAGPIAGIASNIEPERARRVTRSASDIINIRASDATGTSKDTRLLGSMYKFRKRHSWMHEKCDSGRSHGSGRHVGIDRDAEWCTQCAYGKNPREGTPAVIEVEHMCDIMVLAVLKMAKGRASHLAPGPKNIEQACA